MFWRFQRRFNRKFVLLQNMVIVAILIESLFNMFSFWFLDTEMATSWEIGIEKKNLKNAQ